MAQESPWWREQTVHQVEEVRMFLRGYKCVCVCVRARARMSTSMSVLFLCLSFHECSCLYYTCVTVYTCLYV